MEKNKIDLAINEIIDFIKQLFNAYILLFYNPEKLINKEEKSITPRTLAFLGCLIFAVTNHFSQTVPNAPIAYVFFEPLNFFKAFQNVADTSIIKSFITSIPYFGMTYLLGRTITFIFFRKENRIFFMKIFYYYVFWQLVTQTIITVFLVFFILISETGFTVPSISYNLFEFIGDWIYYILFYGIPIINIIRLYRYTSNKYAFISLTLFAIVAVLSSDYCFNKLGTFIENVTSEKNDLENKSPILLFPEDENKIYVDTIGNDSVRLKTKVLLNNTTDKDFYSYEKGIITLENDVERINFNIVNYRELELKKIDKNSMQILNIDTKIPIQQWKILDSISIDKNIKNDFNLRLNCENYQFNSEDSIYQHSIIGYNGNFKEKFKIKFVRNLK